MLIENTPVAWDERATALTPWAASLWSERGQTQRFLALLRHLELRAGETLLDFGAGPGRLCEFLPAGVRYHAFDSSPAMRARAAREHPSANVLETLPELLFDHVVCVGTFNLRDGWSHERTWAQLRRLWQLHTRRTLAVSLYRGSEPGHLRYHPDELTGLAHELGCSRFLIDATYSPNDLLLVMRA